MTIGANELVTIGLTILTLAIGFVTFHPRKKIALDISSPDQINKRSGHSDTEVIVKTRGQFISEPVFSITLAIKNVGNRDISKDDLVHPVKIQALDNAQLIQINPHPESTKRLIPVSQNSDTHEFEWDLLKKREELKVHIQLTHPDESAANLIGCEIRAKDVLVTSNTHFQSFVGAVKSGLLASVVVVLVIVLIGNQGFRQNRQTYLNADGDILYSFSLTTESSKFCTFESSPLKLSTCKDYTLEEVLSLENHEIKKGFANHPYPFPITCAFLVLLGLIVTLFGWAIERFKNLDGKSLKSQLKTLLE